MLNSKIVSGGEAYLNGMKTVENVFPKEMFLSNTVIETVILPKEAVEVAYHAFFGCSTLKKSRSTGNCTSIRERCFQRVYKLRRNKYAGHRRIFGNRCIL